MIYLIELGAHTGTTAVTLRVATASYVTRPTDTPANASFLGRVADPGNFEAFLFSAGKTGGASEVGYGEIVINNPDGKFDAWINYGFDGRPIRIYAIADAFAPFSAATLVFRGSIEQIVTARALKQFRFRIYDRRLDIDKPLQTVVYAGTTTSAGATAEGNVDLKDQVKPLIFGRVFNVPLVCVNVFNLIYQGSASALTGMLVYDGGVPLTYTSDYATIAALNAATLVPGKYASCLAQGIIRLGGKPQYAVTADCTEGATAASRSAAQIVKRMLTRMGMTTADYVDATFTALDTLNAAECGIFLDGEVTALDAMQRVLASVGGYIAPNTLGQFEVGRLSAPGTPVATLTERDFLGEVAFLATDDAGGGIPAYRVTLRYRPVWLVQKGGDLAGCQDDVDFRGFVGNEWREAKAENTAIQTKHLRAPPISLETLLVNPAAAGAEATRRLGLYGVRRDRVRVTVWRQKADGIRRGDTIAIVMGRLGYADGRAMVVTGMRMDNLKGQITLELWG
ncbi:hypothetical protein [Chelatococcus asaccharovorans]|uniref:hypothetical protein n=1 Tax=Chelatococcus asaccharovorans TaxID=28210 RepID=UPI00224C6EA5|nr:hypothetical protein [Chelatococcus asaccharovorans]CAH1672125.1 conserved hypothetical protein [Chelatococcus asaccharovorans]CAH1676460.1 conserved hypothetical protein [Chelatococcus asaccharovorans]